MSDIESLRQTIAAIIPFNRALDISITSVSPDRVELMQPEAPERLNTVGDVHLAASAIFTLGEAAQEDRMHYPSRNDRSSWLNASARSICGQCPLPANTSR